MSCKRAYLALGFSLAGSFCFASIAIAQSAAEILETATSNPEHIDITDAILTNTSPDCGSYAETSTSEVTDLQQQRMLDGAVIITADDDSCTIRSDSIPNHDVGGGAKRNFATPVAEIGSEFRIPRRPQAADKPSRLTHGRFDAILLNGVVVDILSAGCYDPTSRQADENGNVRIGCSDTDPWLLDPESPLAPFTEDEHHAHTQPDGRYHYHGNPMALFDDAPGPNGSPVIGFAADGFPLYGSYFRDETGKVRKAVSGYTLRTGERPSGDGNPGGTYNGMYRADYEFTGAGDLDACNGMTVNGTYGYYVTDTFPWVIACLTGTPESSFRR